MKKLIAWFLEGTKIGRAAKKVQEFLDGKKQLLTGIATAIPATVSILQNFSAHGTEYLLHMSQTPEFAAAGIGWGLVFNAVKGEKTRMEIAQLHETITNPPCEVSETPGRIDILPGLRDLPPSE